jgi:RHH-type proline utilization regulon transcriptional repressor/proline dehydrogenase/delta 1-pyrroline-5-carboxylate dehydrogenase
MLAADAAPGPPAPVRNPARPADVVARVRDASARDVDAALDAADRAAPAWAAVPPAERAAMLLRAGDALEADLPALVGLLAREAGKTASNAVAEVREAVDFLRYYAGQARSGFDNATHRPLGPVACISPWNFPLAIFVGQVAAALAAGNAVLAKPAEQTPLVAAHAVRRLLEAGVPRAAVQLLPGTGEAVGARLVADPRTQGVLFTGSTAVARLLQRTLARRLRPDGQPVPLIAETGGQNAMIVDSSALVEQVVADAMASAFDSAGQRCSALRVLCVQEEAADRLLAMLRGAMEQNWLGYPALLSTDIGPVIDAEARAGIERHVAEMRDRGCAVFRAGIGQDAPAQGTFVVPALIELLDLGQLEREVFGPVLHVVRWKREDLGGLLDRIAATGYGLTMGLHTRIDETVARVTREARAGNLYVNRNMVGAVVGVQPFGGEGLSGTGPKAGGPLYLYRLLSSRPDDLLDRALQAAGGSPCPVEPASDAGALDALLDWLPGAGFAAIRALAARLRERSRAGHGRLLDGPTGERNAYRLAPRETVLCLAETDAARLAQLAAVLAVGGRAVWPAGAAPMRGRLPAAVRERVALVEDWAAEGVEFDAVLHQGDRASLRDLGERLAERPGPIVGISTCDERGEGVALERLLVERAISVNTAAAGGNASLMTIG